jgi:hypothetical protein
MDPNCHRARDTRASKRASPNGRGWTIGQWVRLGIHQIGDRWAAMLLADEDSPPEPGALKGLAFFGATPGEAEQVAKEYLGCSEPGN